MQSSTQISSISYEPITVPGNDVSHTVVNINQLNQQVQSIAQHKFLSTIFFYRFFPPFLPRR